MQPYKIEFYAYCEDEAEAQELSRTLYDFVAAKRSQGVAVRGKKLIQALTKYKDNFFVTNFLK